MRKPIRPEHSYLYTPLNIILSLILTYMHNNLIPFIILINLKEGSNASLRAKMAITTLTNKPTLNRSLKLTQIKLILTLKINTRTEIRHAPNSDTHITSILSL